MAGRRSWIGPSTYSNGELDLDGCFLLALRRPLKVMPEAFRAAFVRRAALLIQVAVEDHHRRVYPGTA